MSLNDSFKHSVNEILAEREMTKVELATAMGVGKSQVQAMLKPDRNVTLETVDKVADALGMTPQIQLVAAGKPGKDAGKK